MSTDDQAGAGRREVAYRLFAAEYDDADFEHAENEADERAPNYVITPTGARVNRLFLVGVLTEVERVNDEMLRGRIVDQTGAFVAYAGQYQPDALTALERADPPMFLAVTGKARTFQPEDADVVYTSVRPESINEVEAETRDRWTVQTARHTLDRIGTMAAALDRAERGSELQAVLEADGVDSGLAAGIPLAIQHYGTTQAYLERLRELSIQSVEVVAGEREAVEPLDMAPDEGGQVSDDLTGRPTLLGATTEDKAEADTGGSIDAEAPGSTVMEDEGAPAGGDIDAEQSGSVEVATASERESDTAVSEAGDDTDDVATGGDTDVVATGDEADDVPPETPTASDRDAAGGEPEQPGADASSGELGDFDPDAETSQSEPSETEAGESAGELYEFEDGEREAIESEYGTDFSTGSEIEEPGDAAEQAEGAPSETAAEDADAHEAGGERTADAPSTDADSEPAGAESGTAEAPAAGESSDTEATGAPEDSDVEEAALDVMRDLDDGDGAQRSAVVETVADEFDVSESTVSEAIEEALMSGKCYEPGDDRLKAI